MSNKLSLGVFGTRDLYDDRIRLKIIETINEGNYTKIVTAGEPHGVCEIARKLAQELGIGLETYYLDIKKGRGMFHHRSKNVIENCDYMLVFHDGISKGTDNEVKLLKKLGKKYEYYKFDKNNDWTVDVDLMDIEDIEL